MKRFITIMLTAFMIIACLPISLFQVSAEDSKGEKRYSVLVLDISDTASFLGEDGDTIYTADTAIEYVKQSAISFLSDVVNAKGDNYISVVTFAESVNVLTEFTDNVDAVTEDINSLVPTDTVRDINAGLKAADSLLSNVEEDAIKNVILVTTGMTNSGDSSYNGRYDENTIASEWRRMDTQIRLYAYANVALETADRIKENANVYVLGLFQTMEEIPEEGKDVAAFFKLTASDLATSSSTFFDVDDPRNIEFAFDEIANSITKVNGSFNYPGSTADYSAEFFYDDNYFTNSSYDGYNTHLATMSLCLELSIWPSIPKIESGDYENSSVNAQNLLSQIGFSDFETNPQYKVKPTEDSIGVGIANKKIISNGEEYTLLAVMVRGGGYEKEWSSNFKIGYNGDAEGFTDAKNQVLDFIQSYIANKEINGKLKFWVVGYSRGGATANLTAAALDDIIYYPNCTYELSDVFAYTFEAPRGTVNSNCHASKYNNIHNIINSNDVVPMVAPEAWEFNRYGDDYKLPSAVTNGNSAVSKMLEKYNSLPSTSEYIKRNDDGSIDSDTYKLDDFEMYEIKVHATKFLPGGDPLVAIEGTGSGSQGTFLSTFMNKFANTYVKNRSVYTSNYEQHVRYLLGTIMGLSSKELNDVIDVATPKFEDGWPSILSPLVNPFSLFKNPQEAEKEAYRKIAQYLGDSLNECGISYDQEKLDEACVMLLDLVMATGTNEIGDAVTLFKTVGCIGNAHYPELCLAWLMSQDSYYTPDGAAEFNSGAYRIIRINCPVDVKVYDSFGNLVAYISDINQSYEEYELICEINNSGEKLIYAPATSEYTFELIAVGDGKVSVTIDEVNAFTGEINKIVNFTDVEVTEGDIISGIIPAYSDDDIADIENASSVTYTLISPNGNNVDYDFETIGEEANKFSIVSFDTSNASPVGILLGSGSYSIGSYAQVEACAYEECTFEGWYIDNELVSKEPIYRFKVVDDVMLKAEFSSAEKSITVNCTDGGSVEGIESGNYAIGTQFVIKAIPNEGYEFVLWESDNFFIEDANSAETEVIVPGEDASLKAVFRAKDDSNISTDKPIESETTSSINISENTTTVTTTSSSINDNSNTTTSSSINDNSNTTTSSSINDNSNTTTNSITTNSPNTGDDFIVKILPFIFIAFTISLLTSFSKSKVKYNTKNE